MSPLDPIEDMIGRVIQREGGYSDNPADRGGPTKFGITQGTLSEWRGKPVARSEVQALTETEARAIYRKRYFEDPGLTAIAEPKLLDLMFDCAVNHGPRWAVKWLQSALGVPADGVFGEETRAALDHAEDDLFARVLAQRIRFYGRVIRHDPTQAVFAEGWLNRAAEFLEPAA